MRPYWILLMSFVFTSCAGIDSSRKENVRTAYYNSAGTITVETDRMLFMSNKGDFTMTGCSNEIETCYASGRQVISVPKICPSSLVEYFLKDDRFELVGYVHDVITIKPRDTDVIMFSHSMHLGITVIYWDYNNSGVLRDRGDGLGIDRVAAQAFAFLPKGPLAPFVCKPSPATATMRRVSSPR